MLLGLSHRYSLLFNLCSSVHNLSCFLHLVYRVILFFVRLFHSSLWFSSSDAFLFSVFNKPQVKFLWLRGLLSAFGWSSFFFHHHKIQTQHAKILPQTLNEKCCGLPACKQNGTISLCSWGLRADRHICSLCIVLKVLLTRRCRKIATVEVSETV